MTVVLWRYLVVVFPFSSPFYAYVYVATSCSFMSGCRDYSLAFEFENRFAPLPDTIDLLHTLHSNYPP